MAAQERTNPFQRRAYSPFGGEWMNQQDLSDGGMPEDRQVFTGADLQAYINAKRVGNLESITWSISVEVVANYVMGRRDAVVHTTGKRVVVGSVVFSQYDKHAFLEEVWRLNTGKNALNIRTIGDMWGYDQPTFGYLATRAGQESSVVLGSPNTGRADYKSVGALNTDNFSAASSLRGLSPEAFDRQLREQLLQTARIVGSQKFRYSDQIPPFDLTLVGVNSAGAASRCAIFGMRITQETAGFSQNDLSNAVGMSFVAIAVDPWLPVELNGSTAYIPPSR